MPDKGKDFSLSIPERFNLAEAIIDASAEKYGHKTAVICVGSKEMGIEEEKVSFRELGELTNKAANALKSLGLNHDDRVLLALPDSVDFFLAFYGTIKLGAIPVPVNTYLHVDDYRYFLEDSRAKIAVVGEAFMDNFHPRSGFLQEVVSAGEFRKMLGEHSSNFENVRLSKDSTSYWQYSSGTTGKPKAVVHRQPSILLAVVAFHKAALGLTEEDVGYPVSKLFFHFGLHAGTAPLYCGATTVVDPERPTPGRSIDIMEKCKVSVLYTVPTFYSAFVQFERSYRGLRLAISGGEPLPAEVWYKFKEKFGVEITEHIGSTEAGYPFIGTYPGQARPGFTGVVMPGVELKLVDDKREEVAEGVPGTVMISGEAVASFYWEKHQQTKEAFVGEWYHTGDMMVKENGYYRYVGRGDDLMKGRGLWVSPLKIEAALLKHPAVSECAVVQGFNEQKIGVVAAYLSIEKSHDAGKFKDEVGDFLREEGLKGFEIPEKWVFVEEIPKTVTGKIQRYKLRELERQTVR